MQLGGNFAVTGNKKSTLLDFLVVSGRDMSLVALVAPRTSSGFGVESKEEEIVAEATVVLAVADPIPVVAAAIVAVVFSLKCSSLMHSGCRMKRHKCANI